ncbi:myb3r transcription factor [Moniliophthora roreri MCA 2997]|uniref:Myb3r transcription factor n=1 Tax=Moniliophthora roreri (strain MCA 2997) TaxID=1381753 RepID=V2X8K4_MONRO|nr:myb3r transcription factor [Moniliophthora roreri MCA 2997]
MVEKAASRPWSQEEDDLLRKAVGVHGAQDNWKAVASEIPGRTNKACRKRWLHSLSPSIKKTPWTQDEDDLLLRLFSLQGPKWSLIARQIPGRTDDACSKRYNEALNPDLKKDEWTPEEEQLLVQVHAEIGDNKWKEVGARLNRSGLACRNRWKQLERKGRISQLISPGGTNRDVNDRPMCQPEPYYPYYPPESYPLFSEGPTTSFREPTPEPTPAVPHAASFQFSSSSLSAALSEPSGASQPSPSSSYLEPPADSSCGSSPTAQHSPMLSPSYQASPAEMMNHTMLLDNFSTQTPFLIFNGLPSLCIEGEPFISHEPGLFTEALDPSGVFSLPQDGIGIELAKLPQGSRLDEAPLYDRQAGSPFSDISPEMIAGEMSSASCSPAERLSQLSPTSSPGSGAPVDLPPNESTPSNSLLFAETPLVPASGSEGAGRPGRKSKSTASAGTTALSSNVQRLSTVMPLSSDRSIKPYACGHQECWPATEETSKACFATSRELWEHSRAAHVDDFQDDRPFRCALPGCGKSWKSLNGIQYHLQVSTAHFQQALSSTFSAGTSESPQLDTDSALPRDGPDTGKRFVCDHPQCYKTYKNASGLRYHKKNGHPRKLPMQLTNMPPSLARDLPLRVRKMRKKDGLQQVSS